MNLPYLNPLDIRCYYLKYVQEKYKIFSAGSSETHNDSQILNKTPRLMYFKKIN